MGPPNESNLKRQKEKKRDNNTLNDLSAKLKKIGSQKNKKIILKVDDYLIDKNTIGLLASSESRATQNFITIFNSYVRKFESSKSDNSSWALDLSNQFRIYSSSRNANYAIKEQAKRNLVKLIQCKPELADVILDGEYSAFIYLSDTYIGKLKKMG